MSFLRHGQSIVWSGSQDRERSSVVLRPDLLTVSMSCDWLFLGGLLSSRARFRFTSRFHHRSIGCNRKPTQGGGIFVRHNGEFSAGVDRFATRFLASHAGRACRTRHRHEERTDGSDFCCASC